MYTSPQEFIERVLKEYMLDPAVALGALMDRLMNAELDARARLRNGAESTTLVDAHHLLEERRLD